MEADNTAVVAVRPRTRLLHGDLSASELDAVTRRIEANWEALADRDCGMSTVEFAHQLRKV